MKEYLEHLSGFAMLLDWQARWRRMSDEIVIGPDGFELGSWVGQRFVIGSPRRPRYGGGAFIGTQSAETTWISRIKWLRATLRTSPGASRLYLVSERMMGDDRNLPDIASFAVGFGLPDHQVANALAEFRVLEGRSIWDDDGRIEVASGAPLFSVPMAVELPGVPVISESERSSGRSLDDLIKERLEQTNRYQPPDMRVR
jgi:hypothetical protein